MALQLMSKDELLALVSDELDEAAVCWVSPYRPDEPDLKATRRAGDGQVRHREGRYGQVVIVLDYAPHEDDEESEESYSRSGDRGWTMQDVLDHLAEHLIRAKTITLGGGGSLPDAARQWESFNLTLGY